MVAASVTYAYSPRARLAARCSYTYYGYFGYTYYGCAYVLTILTTATVTIWRAWQHGAAQASGEHGARNLHGVRLGPGPRRAGKRLEQLQRVAHLGAVE